MRSRRRSGASSARVLSDPRHFRSLLWWLIEMQASSADNRFVASWFVQLLVAVTLAAAKVNKMPNRLQLAHCPAPRANLVALQSQADMH